MSSTINKFLGAASLACAALLMPLSAVAEEAANQGNVRAMAMSVEAIVTDIDLETRQVSLQGPDGNIITMTASEKVVKLEDVSVGDALRATYLAALEGELREPTEEELAQPYVVVQDGGVGEADGQPVAGAARLIHAVCTIEGMNRLLGTVTIMDSNGKVHVIADVEPEKMSNVTLGQTIVMTFSEALALTLEPVAAE
ncbi:hypothetical protein EYC87_06055 [Halieaceae bacterium IMCC8485]|uniref:Uncharacterized protein n=1 Tax=Candidatus Seongchinamella marina TaxID=2518990 RepID=A0ABT3ST31_9GAMM|nr:hypothetical protein [Candidatus Seongchinamella marina]MCX2973149.1 hypothetical protein [Candidatus Seongchinamella marina]